LHRARTVQRPLDPLHDLIGKVSIGSHFLQSALLNSGSMAYSDPMQEIKI
jgi:hypothetical protein